MKTLHVFIILCMTNCFSKFETENSWINFIIDYKDFHEDLKVSIPSENFEVILDTYFFNIDKLITSENEYGKVNFSLVELLNKWNETINNLKDDDIKYLPIDFSDQYIAGFRITKIAADSLSLVYGFSEDYGFSMYTSNPQKFIHSPENFLVHPDYKEIYVHKNDLLQGLKNNIERLKKNGR